MRRIICYLITIGITCALLCGCQHIKDTDAKNKNFSVMSEIEQRQYINKYLSSKYGKDTICDTEISKKQTERDFETTAHTKNDKFNLWISPAGEITDTYFNIAAKKCFEKNLSETAALHFSSYKLYTEYEFTSYPKRIYRTSEWKEMIQDEITRNSIHDLKIILLLPKSDNYHIDDHKINNFIYDIKYLPRGTIETYLVDDPKKQNPDTLPEKPYYKHDIKDNTPEIIVPTTKPEKNTK